MSWTTSEWTNNGAWEEGLTCDGQWARMMLDAVFAERPDIKTAFEENKAQIGFYGGVKQDTTFTTDPKSYIFSPEEQNYISNVEGASNIAVGQVHVVVNCQYFGEAVLRKVQNDL